MSPPLYTSKRTRKRAAPAAIDWPRRPEDVKGGNLRELWQKCQRFSERAGLLEQSMQALRRQYSEYQSQLASATPQSDMLSCAAAKIGMEIVQKAIDLQSPVLSAADADKRYAQDQHSIAWSRYQTLVRALEEGRAAEDREGGRIDETQAAAEIRGLIGPLPWEARR